MPVSFQCSSCGQLNTVHDQQAGTQVACTSCGAQQMAPAAGGYGAPPQQPGGYGAPPQQQAPGGYGPPPQQAGGYGAPPQQAGGYGAPPGQQAPGGHGAPPQQQAPGGYGAPPQQQPQQAQQHNAYPLAPQNPYPQPPTAPAMQQSSGNPILARIGGTIGFIVILILVNIVTYFGCGYIVY